MVEIKCDHHKILKKFHLMKNNMEKNKSHPTLKGPAEWEKFQRTLILVFEVILQPPKTHFFLHFHARPKSWKSHIVLCKTQVMAVVRMYVISYLTFILLGCIWLCILTLCIHMYFVYLISHISYSFMNFCNLYNVSKDKNNLFMSLMWAYFNLFCTYILTYILQWYLIELKYAEIIMKVWSEKITLLYTLQK